MCSISLNDQIWVRVTTLCGEGRPTLETGNIANALRNAPRLVAKGEEGESSRGKEAIVRLGALRLQNMLHLWKLRPKNVCDKV
jgi:hypothetical protein